MEKYEILKVLELLEKAYPDAAPQLKFGTPFQLLVAVMLSAQCTDKRVNIVTEELFKHYSTPQDFAVMEQEELEKYIFSCGFYHDKAKHIISASRSIVKDYGGEVPHGLEQLRGLAGVGRKTANVVASVAFEKNAIAVDTHVFRVSNRIGIAQGDNVLKTELSLMENIPEERWGRAHHLLIFHGRNICKARPLCQSCTVREHCEYYKNIE